jgi:hypothetical protein
MCVDSLITLQSQAFLRVDFLLLLQQVTKTTGDQHFLTLYMVYTIAIFIIKKEAMT